MRLATAVVMVVVMAACSGSSGGSSGSSGSSGTSTTGGGTTGATGGTSGTAGTTPIGGDCSRTDECATGWCTASPERCPGQCAAYVQPGQPCGFTDRCVSGYSCDASTNTCKPSPAPGNHVAGQSCTSISDCLVGLECDGQTFTCFQPIQDGQACSPGAGRCVLNDFCDPATSLCTAPSSTNGACQTFHFDGGGVEHQNCQGGDYCDYSDAGGVGTCMQDLQPGAPCTPQFSDVDVRCAYDYCINGQCAALCTSP